MNFVTKNLGWILLLVFFLFMLFVISSNKENPSDNGTGSLIGSTQSGSTQADLDSLVEMIDADIETPEIIEEIQEDSESDQKKENIEDIEIEYVEEEDIKEEKKSLFSRIFSRDTKEDDKNNANNQEGNTGSSLTETNKDEEKINPRDDLIGLSGEEKVSSSQNVMKKSGNISNTVYSDAQKYAPEIFSDTIVYPGIDLETKVGNNFEIGVYSLKLNNKYFNETLAYMMRGDMIKQLTQENAYGCFQVEILESVLSHNIGKTGYVCKKYLQESKVKVEEVGTKVIVDSKIGDFITIEKIGVKLGTHTLNIGDIVDQFSQADDRGCFVAHVYQSMNVLNRGKVGIMCVSNLY